ncbi:ABC transporter ATP-binding protein [Aureimonas pseudogalii]|uniref:Iron(III) transport system ATP-binding protein n=1 Tax=Aureimonas pseudogalii TaxID=1744844 RepID=A0A7W6H4Y0_9HYPH|nr:ABC transporter ATP-binding protein [Aureimonas pseudogalii]MBB3998632.1 iron(III) transport system ATP-binding protein [Aureimonas pseudogalii]
MTFLRLEALGKRYGSVQALGDVTLAVAAGSRTAIVGPSGSGKSTLLRLVAGFDAPDSGRIVLDGQPLAEGALVVPAHRRAIGMVSQDGALFPHLSVADNVGFGLERRDPGRARRIDDLMNMVELRRELRERRPHELSGGQQQRVALARALARSPRLMLLDEPFSALDTGLRDTMRRAVADVLQRAGVASLLVTHDQSEALSFADQVAVLREGRLAQAGSPQSLYFQPMDSATASFLGEAVVLDATIRDGHADCRLGRLPVHGAITDGPSRIMLRPEQLHLRRGSDASAPRGRVTAVEFAGAHSLVHLSLMRGESGTVETEIRLRLPSLDAPSVGEVLGLAVAGRCHVLGTAAG